VLRVSELDLLPVKSATSPLVADELERLDAPLVYRGAAEHLPLVAAGRESVEVAQKLIASYSKGEPVKAARVPASADGRIYYDESLTGFNYQGGSVSLDTLFGTLNQQVQLSSRESIYMGSTHTGHNFPGFDATHSLGLEDRALSYLWMGNQCRVAAHFDYPQNLAVNLVGRREFTLFAPEQIENLYPGPYNFAPGGQEVSMVDFNQVDLEKFPRFKQALEGAQRVVLEPGDALYIPSCWWHHVESLDDFNVLWTHWWPSKNHCAFQPRVALNAALLGLRGLPDNEKRAWKSIFDFYIFGDGELARDQLPEAAQQILAEHPTKQDVERLLLDLQRMLSR